MNGVPQMNSGAEWTIASGGVSGKPRLACAIDAEFMRASFCRIDAFLPDRCFLPDPSLLPAPEPTPSDVRYLAAIKGKADMPLTCLNNRV